MITAGRKENDEEEREAEEAQSLLPSELRYLFSVGICWWLLEIFAVFSHIKNFTSGSFELPHEICNKNPIFFIEITLK